LIGEFKQPGRTWCLEPVAVNLPDPRILEPAAGVGRFLGLQPPEMAERSHRTAVELEALTARLLKQLYPRVAVHALGFQDAPLRDDWFDVAVSITSPG